MNLTPEIQTMFAVYETRNRRTGKLKTGGVIHQATADEVAYRQAHAYSKPWYPNRYWNSWEQWITTFLRQNGPHCTPCGIARGLRPATDEELDTLRLCKQCFGEKPWRNGSIASKCASAGVWE